MVNGHAGEQIQVQESLQPDPCANCGQVTQKVIAYYACNPSTSVLRAVSANPNAVAMDFKAKEAFGLCFCCLRTEYWTVNPNNPKEWNKVVTSPGREPVINSSVEDA